MAATWLMYVTNPAHTRCLKKIYAGSVHVLEADLDQNFRFFCRKRLIQLNLAYCSWMNRNKKPSDKETIFYFMNAWVLPRLPSIMWRLNLI
jgi:hypothetical protein